jgi:T-complex protein 1 subunit gamma
VRLLTELRAKKAGGANPNLGIDGDKGVLADMAALGVWDTFAVRAQVFKSAIESACLLLRIDDILSGIKNKHDTGPSRKPAEEEEAEGGAGGPREE